MKRHDVWLFWEQKDTRFGPSMGLNAIWETEDLAVQWMRAYLADNPTAYVWIEKRETNHAFGWNDLRRLRTEATPERHHAECDTCMDRDIAFQRLREALTMGGVTRPQAFHAYECPYWRVGRRHGPCNCGGVERQAKLDELLEDL